MFTEGLDLTARKEGILIAIEGCDGSGKSELAKRLTDHLNSIGIKTIASREPGGCKISEDIRNVILNNKDLKPETEALLFAAARTQHIYDTILPALSDGTNVITDRYISSSYAYQGYARFLGEKYISKINPNFPPDLVIYLDINPDIALDRIYENNRDTNRFDEQSISFHQIARLGFKRTAKLFNTIQIDARKDRDEVFEEALKYIITYFNFNKEA